MMWRRDASTTAGGTPALLKSDTANADAVGDGTSVFDAPVAGTAEILKFLIDRTGYIKLLEAEDTPEAFSGWRTCANW